MEDTELNIIYNAENIDSIKAFAQKNGRVHGSSKEVYFVRALGTAAGLCEDVRTVDQQLFQNSLQGRGKYLRINSLPRLLENSEIEFYRKCCEEWMGSGMSRVHLRSIRVLELEAAAAAAFRKVLEKFRTSGTGISESIEKNFVIKLMFWLDHTAAVFLENWKISEVYKFVYCGLLKKQEYLFCYLLTLLGIDVLMIQPEREVEAPEALTALSEKLVLGQFGPADIPEYHPEQARPVVVNVRRADRDQRTGRRKELTFEELALLASSVVMITIHDKDGKVLGSGSGIMISREGYILTNNHVASGGCFYSVRIEDDDKIYHTDEMIKYNQFLDLAIIRIDRRLHPVPFYQGGKPLVRGQKVVAIGSPLGLFNSVSDGIISGFRKIDNVDMIQFTAPTSHGSSGGAVFNMYGEVIGISTAGIDNGQNINLAVGYECINNFIRGFYKLQ